MWGHAIQAGPGKACRKTSPLLTNPNLRRQRERGLYRLTRVSRAWRRPLQWYPVVY
jgi:hypothetical protein